MSDDEPQKKKTREDPQPPNRPLQGGPEGEAVAVVASNVSPSDRIESTQSAFRKRLQKFDYKLTDKPRDLKKFLEEFQKEFEKQLKINFKEQHGIKIYFVLTISYRSSEYPAKEPWVFYVGSSAHMIMEESKIEEKIKQIYTEMERKNDNLVRSKTGLILDEINWASLFISR